MGFELDLITERRIKSLLCVVLILLIFATLLGAWRYSKINFVDEDLTEMRTNEHSLKDKTAAHQNVQEFEGRIVFMSPDSTFIRVSTDERTIYSVSITKETKIVQEGSTISLSRISATSVLKITANKLLDTEQFDFQSESIEIIPTPTLTVEERIEALSKSGMGESIDF